MEFEQYEAEVKKNEKANRVHISTFEKWLKGKNLSDKTIRRHAGNVDLYLNYYLNYYDPQDVKAGCYSIGGYLGGFYARKVAWASCSQIKSNAASIKKFYACMLEQGVVEKDDYAYLYNEIKEEMEVWLEDIRQNEEELEDMDMLLM